MNRQQRRASAKGSAAVPQVDIPKVVIGTVHPGEVSMAYTASILRVKDYMLRYGLVPGFLERRARSANIWRARNEIVGGFLLTDCDYLFFVDADMGLPENTIEKLLAVAHVDERPIVAGLCFGQRETGFNDDDYSTTFDCFPTVNLWNVEDDGTIESFSIVGDYPRDAVIQVDSTGAACVMIHRTVLEKMRAEFGDNWFTPRPHKTGGQFGEDTSFFLRCRDIGVPVHMDTSVKTSHDKGDSVYLTEALWDLQQALRAAA